MIKLVLNDIKIQRKIYIIYFICLFIFGGCFFIEFNNKNILDIELYEKFNIYYFIYILFFLTCSINYIIAKSLGKRNNLNILIRSLPIKQEEIVISKSITPIVIFIIYEIPNVLFQIIYSHYANINIIVGISGILVTFILFYITSLVNLYVNLLNPESRMAYYIRMIPILIIIVIMNVINSIYKYLEEFTLNLENLNVVLIFISLFTILGVLLLLKFVLKKYKSIEL
ncbi:ABC-2 transporter permease [Eubacterium multiforme]|uniref:ABC-2 transporter permease n=1 Tax=Eubacterium multiforme TaxID=83339 RepID=UPI00361E6452